MWLSWRFKLYLCSTLCAYRYFSRLLLLISSSCFAALLSFVDLIALSLLDQNSTTRSNYTDCSWGILWLEQCLRSLKTSFASYFSSSRVGYRFSCPSGYSRTRSADFAVFMKPGWEKRYGAVIAFFYSTASCA